MKWFDSLKPNHFTTLLCVCVAAWASLFRCSYLIPRWHRTRAMTTLLYLWVAPMVLVVQVILAIAFFSSGSVSAYFPEECMHGPVCRNLLQPAHPYNL